MSTRTIPQTERTTRAQTRASSLFAKLQVDRVWLGCALGAAVLLLVAAFMPLWTMNLKAPQYPGGLGLTAYGTRMEGDLREINALNHYVGVKPIEPNTVTELKLFPFAIAAVIGLVVLAGLVKRWRWLSLRWLATALVWAVPIGFLIDLQWWLYKYGHDLDPAAPLRIPEFTPKVIGTTKVINFHSETMVTTGFWLMVAAALLMTFGPRAIGFLREAWANTGESRAAGSVAAGLLIVAVVAAGDRVAPASAADVPPVSIQAAIDAAAPGDTVVIPAGVYEGPVVVDKTITLVGDGWPVIDGRHAGDVVVIAADGVTLRGFVIQGSGRDVSNEPGGIRLEGDYATIEGNQLRDVLYGIILIHSDGHIVRDNTVVSLEDEPTQRRGHAIYLWNTSHNLVERNTIRTAKDGIFLGFASFNEIRGNHVADVRYGIHYMYADDNAFFDNVFRDNIAGAAIMYSRRIELSGNEFAYNTSSASGYGILLKDVDDVTIRGNRIHHNRLGMTMEGAPQSPLAFVRVEDNLIGYNQVALEMSTTTNAVFVGNTFIGNLKQVESRGGDIGKRNVWSEDGRGNYWDAYQGYDANGDGVGDIPFRYEGVYDDLIEKNEALKAYQYTFAHTALDLTARWFPVYRPEPRVVDPAPLMSPTRSLPADAGARRVATSLGVAALLVVLPLAGFGIARSTFRRRWTPCSP
ncbi:MAG: hypothetical protein Kow0010_20530 [Dehalococcoidia bacterium]